MQSFVQIPQSDINSIRQLGCETRHAEGLPTYTSKVGRRCILKRVSRLFIFSFVIITRGHKFKSHHSPFISEFKFGVDGESKVTVEASRFVQDAQAQVRSRVGVKHNARRKPD